VTDRTPRGEAVNGAENRAGTPPAAASGSADRRGNPPGGHIGAIAEVLASLQAADMVIDHRAGERGVQSLCPVCVRPMLWHEGLPGFVCDCGGRTGGCEHGCTPSRIADEIHQRGESRRGGYGRELGWNGAGSGEGEGPRLRFTSAADLRAATPEEQPWAWDGYLARGAVTMLAGKPKYAGKSTLAWAAAEALAAGAPAFLGRRVEGGPVVYVSEEGAGTLRHKLPASDRVSVLTRDAAWPKPAWPGLVTAAVDEAERIGAVLLVIDALSFWAGFAKDAEKDSGAAQAVMDALGLATRPGLAVLLVHHHRKSGGEEGDAVRGSGAIFGAVDALVELESLADDAPPGQRRLVGVSRWEGATPAVLVVERDAATAAWRVIGEADDRGATADLTLRERLLRAVPGEEPGATEPDLAESVGVDKRKVAKPLRALVNEGVVLRDGEGKPYQPYRYRRAADATLPPGGGETGAATLPHPEGGQRRQETSPPSPGGELGAVAEPEAAP
jgi:hypothetical protein